MADASTGRDSVEGPENAPDPSATVEDLFSDLADLTGEDPAEDTRREVREETRDVKHLLAEAHRRGLIDSGVRQLDLRDAAEAFVGSVIFAAPLLVEDGVFDIAEYLFEFRVHGVPVFLIANTLFVVLMTYAMLEWTGRNTRDSDLLFGVFPLRVFVILGVSFVVSALLMTVWGRVGDWRPPAEALARVNVIWTVGSLGAALGDIVSEGNPSASVLELEGDANDGAVVPPPRDATDPPETPDRVRAMTDSELVDALHREFDDLASVVPDSSTRSEVQRIRGKAIEATVDEVFGDRIRKYTSRDVAEAFVGSIFFSIPFLVEDGVFDVAEYFLSYRVGLFPVFFLVNAVFVLVMILGLVYWAGPQDVQVSRPIFGFVPPRLVGTAVVSFLTAAALMTMWGRVGNWEDPVVALARISVVWTVASHGAALGDILPGESSGDDINDDLAALGELMSDDSAG